MKTLTISIVLLCCFGSMEAQTNHIERILRDIEQNNKELQAGEQNLSAQKMGTKIENNLSNPEVSYSYQYGKDDLEANQSELNVTQGFDFPTLYASRNKYGKLQNEAYEKRFGMMRRDVLLKAKELCLEMIHLNQQKNLLDSRKKNAEELVAFYEKRLQTGDANVLETNKVKLELMAVNTEVAENDVAFRTALQSLLAMNGNMPLTFDEVEYPLLPELVSFEQLRDEVFSTDYELQSVSAEKEAARKMITVSKNGWLPGLQVGYRRSGSIGDEIHGFIVGGSIPLFENRGKVKKAKAESLSADLQQQNVALRIEAELHSQFNEAQQLKKSMETYDLLLMKNTLDYLKQALMAGQISVIEYFTEVESIYQNQQKYMDLENRYQKVMAQLYKNSL